MHLGTSEFDEMREPQVVPPDFGYSGKQGSAGCCTTTPAESPEWATPDRPWPGFRPSCGCSGKPDLRSRSSTTADRPAALRAVFEQGGGRLAGITVPDFPSPPPWCRCRWRVDIERVVGVTAPPGLEGYVPEGDGGRVKLRYAALYPGWESFVDDDEQSEYTGQRDDALIAVRRRRTGSPALTVLVDVTSRTG